MADLRVTGEVDELAVALVQALARGDGDAAMGLALALDPLIGDRPSLRARHATWMAQAHQLRGEIDQATSMIRHAISLATIAGDSDALPALKALKTQLVTGKIAAANAAELPMPETLLGRAVHAMDHGEMENGAGLARQARIEAQSLGNSRDEVLSLLALARIPGQEDSAIRAAYEVADQSNDKNLITAVSRAARAANVVLPSTVF